MTDVPGQDSAELEEFVRAAQQRAGLESYNEAHQLCRATARALGTSVSGGQAKQLAQWLPDVLEAELGDKSGHAERFDKTTFLNKIGGETHTVDMESMERQASAVLSVLRSWAPTGQVDDTIAQLPRELSALFE
ncbi:MULTISPECIES: DUF2267 domain-containing protein [Prauserella salsuginis group]|uniref:Uncharacterized protein (DUF2267 family) n=2 Tax=Prauserella salsuginis group TaxID=2893672 RepID=A0A839XNY7_9PSEU|nr:MULTISPECIES: DUF2267 domain-containing protein [Prauserella salsuginis group]MBB3663204.1 uncharacterized protein (DUF2267 family) [Prauserella sediminis]MCR3720969.1 Uncharacterized conserved protein, DUF2267 family [Prauserella flava]MCR3734950.1 Uncharacterized conserved protein, DUF2267 family [Prauserella salsuginis]